MFKTNKKIKVQNYFKQFYIKITNFKNYKKFNSKIFKKRLNPLKGKEVQKLLRNIQQIYTQKHFPLLLNKIG